MANYRIEVTVSAVADLSIFPARERRAIVQAVGTQLSFDPLTETANRTTLRTSSSEGPWELRIGRFRVFYAVDDEDAVVCVLAIGQKIHTRLLIQGEEIGL